MKHNKVTFWCGSPRYWFSGKFRKFGASLQTFLGASPTVWIPHAERSTLVLGAPGSGKTFGTIDRMAESCMVQGFPLIVYDKKGDQMKLLAPLAARYGYDVRIFAPGEPYSEIINPLDFMENQEDAVSAAQIAQVINANAGGISTFCRNPKQLPTTTRYQTSVIRIKTNYRKNTVSKSNH